MLSTKTLRAAIDAIVFGMIDTNCHMKDEDFTALRELFNEYENARYREERTTNDKLDV